MKVCFFSRSYWPELGAVGQLLTELTEDLVQHHGCEVSVVAGLPLASAERVTRASFVMRRELHNGVHIVRAGGTMFPKERFAGRAANYITYFLCACVAAIRIGGADVVVSLTDPPIIGLAALLAARRCGARFVFVCQDVFPEVARLVEDFHSLTVERCLEWVGRFLIAQADRVIVPGEAMRDRLVAAKGAEPRKVVVIHNWADCVQIVPGPKENAVSLTHGWADSFVVMHSGNVGLSQDLDTLLDVAYLLRSYRDIVIAIVGDGVKRTALERRVRAEQLSNVRFLPYQAKADLSQSFATADVHIVSLKQGLAGCIVPSKLYGILASGRPYVAAVERACEVAAITGDYGCGLIVEPGNSREIAENVLRLYHDRSLGQRLGANGRRAALRFDRKRQVQAYYDILRDLAANPRGIGRANCGDAASTYPSLASG